MKASKKLSVRGIAESRLIEDLKYVPEQCEPGPWFHWRPRFEHSVEN